MSSDFRWFLWFQRIWQYCITKIFFTEFEIIWNQWNHRNHLKSVCFPWTTPDFYLVPVNFYFIDSGPIKFLLFRSNLNLNSFLFTIPVCVAEMRLTLVSTHNYSWIFYMVFWNRSKSSSNSLTDSWQPRLNLLSNEKMCYTELGCICRYTSQYIVNRWKIENFILVFRGLSLISFNPSVSACESLLTFSKPKRLP